MAVRIGMTVTNFLKPFFYRFKRDHYDKSIGTRELLELIYLY